MLKIGDLSRIARVSVKTLRHYDAIGLLRADHVEPTNRYRFYSLAQIDRLERILALKALGFGLEAIQLLLDPATGHETLESALARQRAELKDRIAADRARLRQVETWLTEPSLAAIGAPPVLRAIEPIRAWTRRARVERASNAVEEMFESAEAEVARRRIRADASPFLLFHDAVHDDRAMDVEVCVPVAAAAEGPSVRIVPGCARAGAMTYRGSYERTAPLHAGMLRWLAAGGHRPKGPLREVYRRFGADQRGYTLPARVLAADAEDYVTELQVPLR